MRILASAIFVMIAGCQPALGQSCSFSIPNVDFGSVDLTSGNSYGTSVNLTYSCTGTPGNKLRICPNFNSGSGGANNNGSTRYMLFGTTRLNYNLYQKRNYSSVWGSYIWGKPPDPPTVTTQINGNGVTSGKITMHARIPNGQSTLPVGTYTSSFAGSETNVNYAYDSAGNCAAISGANLNVTQTPFIVTVSTDAVCSITATDIDFGTQTLLNANVDRTNVISVICPVGLAYNIGLGGGTAGPVAPDQRRMTNGVDTVTYGIYRDSARTAGWGGSVGVNTVSGTGTGAYQNYTAYSRIPPQTTPPPDIYDDAIVVTVTY